MLPWQGFKPEYRHVGEASDWRKVCPEGKSETDSNGQNEFKLWAQRSLATDAKMNFDSISQGCFLVMPSSASNSPTKKAKSKGTPRAPTAQTSSAAPTTPSRLEAGDFQPLLDGEESIEAVQLRMRLYKETWSEMKSKIDKILSQINKSAFESIGDFVETAYDRSMDHNGLIVLPFHELPTALVFAGTHPPAILIAYAHVVCRNSISLISYICTLCINVPDHDAVFAQITLRLQRPDADTGAEIRRKSNHVALLQSKDCPNLKTTMKNMIEQFMGIERGTEQEDDGDETEEGQSGERTEEVYNLGKSTSTRGCRLPNYDMQVLEGWYQHIVSVGAVAGNKRKNGSMTTPAPLQRPNLVVILQDFESFDPVVLQDFITICRYGLALDLVYYHTLCQYLETAFHIRPPNSEYQLRLPIILLVGIATSTEALHQALPKSVLSLLRMERFHLQQSDRWFGNVVEEVKHNGVEAWTKALQISAGSFLLVRFVNGIRCGEPQGESLRLPMVLSWTDLIQYSRIWPTIRPTLCSLPTSKPIHPIQYAVMHHFYANPLSIFTPLLTTADLRDLQSSNVIHPSHIDHLRMLPSFRRHIENLSTTEPSRALALLDPDPSDLLAALPTHLRALRDHHTRFRVGFTLLVSLQSCFAAYSTLRKPKRMLYLAALQDAEGLKGSDTVKFLVSLVGKMRFGVMKTCVKKLVDGLKAVVEDDNGGGKEVMREAGCDVEMMIGQLEKYRAKLEMIKGQMEEGKEGESGDDMEREGGVGKRKLMRLGVDEGEEGGRQTKVSRKLKMEEKKGELERAPKEVREYEGIVEAVKTFIMEILEMSLCKYTTLPFHEIVYYSNVKLHEKTFTAQPRAAIQTALAQPLHYLNCDCCRDIATDALSATQHDTCILYKLYLECNRMINMYDWFVAFGVVLEREARGAKGKIEEREVQYPFYMAAGLDE
ncbi:origin recognition complex subunit 3 N-terminus-domain-containing protein [Jimgerdemannia flammicorona]|uniref:Origin recognition complex subunit 3 N-terminus-domain-containing protein n=1 Tax=Jimgerdemannia flammicorona TaxID=994334 RepID=A0A433QNC0_9FUNG|nr:origin recognition complex subunit 3 N-terminus-domain-containing protein [Jimgerdemannia flammicorona]